MSGTVDILLGRTQPPLPPYNGLTHAVGWGSGLFFNGKLYVFIGHKHGSYTPSICAKVLSIDPYSPNAQWEEVSAASNLYNYLGSETLPQHVGSCVYGTKIFRTRRNVNNSYSNTHGISEEYVGYFDFDGGSSWVQFTAQQANNFISTTAGHLSVVLNNRLYIIGGANFGYYFASLYSVDITSTSNPWTMNNMLFNGVGFNKVYGIVFTYNNKIYVGSGKAAISDQYNNTTNVGSLPNVKYIGWMPPDDNTIYEIDPDTGIVTASDYPNIPVLVYWQNSGVQTGNKFYLVRPDAGVAAYLDLEKKIWVDIPKIPTNDAYDCGLYYDQFENYLWFLSRDDGLFSLKLDSNQKPVGNWSYKSYAYVGAKIISAPSPSFYIDAGTLALIGSGSASILFDSYGRYVDTFVNDSIPNPFFDVQVGGSCLVGVAASANLEFDINVFGTNKENKFNGIEFEIGCFGEGALYTTIVSKKEAGASFKIGVDAQGAHGAANVQPTYLPFTVTSEATGLTGVVGSAKAEISFDLRGSVNVNRIGTGKGEILLNLVAGYGHLEKDGELVYESEIDAYAVNGLSSGHCALMGINANGFMVLGSKLYIAGNDGIHLFEGEDDNGLPIDAFVSYPVSDFNVANLKRLSDVYIQLRTDGKAQVRLVADEQKDRFGYEISDDGREGFHRRRKKVHRGIAGSVWQVEIRNVDGSRLDIDNVEIRPAVSKRKI